MTTRTPYLFLFTGTSGSGRKTAAHLALKDSGIAFIPSCTDRPPRRKEPPDGDYRFVSSLQFDYMLRSRFFAESVRIDRYRYGIGKRYLDLALEAGNDVYLILNQEGSEAIRAQYGERVVRIFLYVDKKTMQERLENKGTPYEVVDSYLRHYSHEVTYRKDCEHVIENITLEHTVRQIRAIIDSYRATR